jgi:hypothetical protein
MRNLYFTERSLQFSSFTHKSLGSSFSLSPLFFLSLFPWRFLLCFFHRQNSPKSYPPLSLSLSKRRHSSRRSSRLVRAQGGAQAARVGERPQAAARLRSGAGRYAGGGTARRRHARERTRLGRPTAGGASASGWRKADGTRGAGGRAAVARRVGSAEWATAGHVRALGLGWRLAQAAEARHQSADGPNERATAGEAGGGAQAL